MLKHLREEFVLKDRLQPNISRQETMSKDCNYSIDNIISLTLLPYYNYSKRPTVFRLLHLYHIYQMLHYLLNWVNYKRSRISSNWVINNNLFYRSKEHNWCQILWSDIMLLISVAQITHHWWEWGFVALHTNQQQLFIGYEMWSTQKREQCIGNGM